MNYKKLFAMQKELDHHIETKHQLQNENLFDRKVLALLVELGELANETRCFKFWSLKPLSARETILEEFVDGVHFILSLGLECAFEQESDFIGHTNGKQSLNEQFLFVFEKINQFRNSKEIKDFKELVHAYLHLGDLLGFTAEDIENAYIDKNEVNYERQQQGY
ncbi:dUTPase [Cytobacillus depressus]|uniref:dUTPase n=1 Tax=Cytobacillus depressus TaxID=1602942 RepID=A0A6L3VHA0_9BACI|nr:dUTP diphosphatase [Cytobacillus depressus]KAB2338784.1 dUTPase [Cytobacillus depressus]